VSCERLITLQPVDMQLDKPRPAGGRNCPYAVNEREADSVVWMPVIQRVVSLGAFAVWAAPKPRVHLGRHN
jgi:hypothetical protein